MATQTNLRYPLFCLVLTAIFLVAGNLGADIVNGEQATAGLDKQRSPIDVIRFLEPESTNLLNFNPEQTSVSATVVLPYSLYQEKAQAAPIPEPSSWTFVIFCMLIWGVVYTGRTGRPLRHAS